MTSLSAVSITDRELAPHLERATRKIRGFPFRAPEAPEATGEGATLRGRSVAYRPMRRLDGDPRPEEREFSLAGRIQEIGPVDDLYTDAEHHALRLLRRGVQLFYYIYAAYEEASGLGRLKAANRAGSLGADAEPELKAKVEAGSAAALFALCAYLWAGLAPDEGAVNELPAFEVDARGELPLGSRDEALHAGLHAFYRAIDGHARDDASLVHAIREAAREQAERLQALRHSLRHVEFFTRYHYRVEPDDVPIEGFELPELRIHSDINVPVKRPEEVVGNHVAKLEAIRIAQRLACYDVERRENPFVELGGFVFSFIGDGQPGTGKTTLIQMIVSLLRDYTEVAGVPLRYENFSVDEISDYQGRSGQNAKRFCQTVLDPGVVGFGTVDDVDQVCASRGDRNASAGQLEVTGVFMQELGGANTVVRGNATFGFFSNYPEKVDPALRQRAQARFLVDGPQTHHDYTDLLHILLGDHLSVPGGEGWRPLAAQDVRQRVEQKYAAHAEPRSPELGRILAEVRSSAGGRFSSWTDFGLYLHALKEHDPSFTGRAIKNVADAVRARMMDFDLPAEWLQKREAFFARPYETRVAMLEELRGEVTPEMVLQEINRYADSEARYGEAADRREIEERTRLIVLDAKARKAASDHEV